jgi:hypothetical protein
VVLKGEGWKVGGIRNPKSRLKQKPRMADRPHGEALERSAIAYCFMSPFIMLLFFMLVFFIELFLLVFAMPSFAMPVSVPIFVVSWLCGPVVCALAAKGAMPITVTHNAARMVFRMFSSC